MKALERGTNGTFTLSEWGQRLLQYGRRCAYCQDPEAIVEVEHVVPFSRNGDNRISNVVPACAACNSEKGTLTPGEWLTSSRPRVAAGLAGPHKTPLWPVGTHHHELLADPCPRRAGVKKDPASDPKSAGGV